MFLGVVSAMLDMKGGAAIVLDDPRSGVLRLGFELFNRSVGVALRMLHFHPASGCRRAESAVDQAIFGGGSTRVECQCTRERRFLVLSVQPSKKEVWTMSTLSTWDCLVQPPDWPGFRRFPPVPSVCRAWNPVRVPPRARHTPSPEGVFALTCVHFGWSGPSDSGRGVCLAPRVACLVVGERVQGLGRWALRVL